MRTELFSDHRLFGLYAALQLLLLVAPFLILGLGLFFGLRLRKSRPGLALALMLVPLVPFVWTAVTTVLAHQSRMAALTERFIQPAPGSLPPGAVLSITLYGERGAVAAANLARVGLAEETYVLVENGQPWRATSAMGARLQIGAAEIMAIDGWSDPVAAPGVDLNDIDYIAIAAQFDHISALDPEGWDAVAAAGYDGGLVTMLFANTGDGLPDLSRDIPIWRFGQTNSVRFALPNWSTDWAFEDRLQISGLSPPVPGGQTRFDTLRAALAGE